MAALPDAPAPKTTRSGPAEKAQKPDIKLSKDVIAGHKQGMTAPLEQLKQEETDKKKRVGKRGGLSGFTGEKARRGEIPNFTGIDSPYEAPETADLILKTHELSVEECVAEVVKHV